jgi:hypothetical protein
MDKNNTEVLLMNITQDPKFPFLSSSFLPALTKTIRIRDISTSDIRTGT